MKVIRNENNPQAISFPKFLLDVRENNSAIEIIDYTDIIRILNDLSINNDLTNTPETLMSYFLTHMLYKMLYKCYILGNN